MRAYFNILKMSLFAATAAGCVSFDTVPEPELSALAACLDPNAPKVVSAVGRDFLMLCGACPPDETFDSCPETADGRVGRAGGCVSLPGIVVWPGWEPEAMRVLVAHEVVHTQGISGHPQAFWERLSALRDEIPGCIESEGVAP